MDNNTAKRYRELRAEHPFMSAATVLAWAKTPDASEGWEAGRRDNTWTREVEGFTIRLHVEEESIFPIPNKHGDTDYGSYVDEVRNYYDYDSTAQWGGNWNPPREDAPLGIPYTSIRYDGPGWTQGEQGGYFIPDDIEGTFESFRRAGQSKSVAWDLTKADVEAQISMLFHSPLTNCYVKVSAHREGVELADTGMGTDVSGDDEGRAYIFEMVAEHGMVEEVIEQARETIARLATTT